ncbi:hypothetical protein BLOT_000255 [Blomia tropicalis]|nr:hypothetical protein BLOT_000255 [Blomia tropicalis]
MFKPKTANLGGIESKSIKKSIKFGMNILPVHIHNNEKSGVWSSILFELQANEPISDRFNSIPMSQLYDTAWISNQQHWATILFSYSRNCEYDGI